MAGLPVLRLIIQVAPPTLLHRHSATVLSVLQHMEAAPQFHPTEAAPLENDRSHIVHSDQLQPTSTEQHQRQDHHHPALLSAMAH